MNWSPAYTYRAEITRVVDGDTVDAVVDLGFGVTMPQRLRLLNINAPEMVGKSKAAGIAAREHLAKLLRDHTLYLEADIAVVAIRSHKDKSDSFGRYLAELLGEDDEGRMVNLNDRMVADGHAVEDIR